MGSVYAVTSCTCHAMSGMPVRLGKQPPIQASDLGSVRFYGMIWAGKQVGKLWSCPEAHGMVAAMSLVQEASLA